MIRSDHDHEQEFLTIAQAARWTGLTEASIRNRIFRSQLPARKLGARVLIEKSAVQQLLVAYQ